MALDTANPDQIADIKLPYKAPVTFKEILPWALAGYVILFIISFLVYYFEKRKKNEKIFVRRPKPKEQPHVIAYRELDRLKGEKLWQKSKIKEYYSHLTEILRVYIEDRFYVRAMEQTTDETMESFKQNQLLDSLLFDSLKNTLLMADLAKFAKAVPLADENEKCLKDAYMFIDRTKQVFQQIEKETIKSGKNEDTLEHENKPEVLSETNAQNSTDI